MLCDLFTTRYGLPVLSVAQPESSGQNPTYRNFKGRGKPSSGTGDFAAIVEAVLQHRTSRGGDLTIGDINEVGSMHACWTVR